MRTRVTVQGRRGRWAWAVRGLWSVGEVAVTLGVVLLLLVVHQVWWTNRQARAEADRQVATLEREWAERESRDPGTEPEPGPGADSDPGPDADSDPDSDPGPDADPDAGSAKAGREGSRTTRPRWDQAYAIVRIPDLGVTAPVARGVSTSRVLDKGYVGHYPGTAQPGKPGNVALAGHRNTHGEPFRRLDRLGHGDTVEVETAEARYVYTVDRVLPRTTPGDGAVIADIPRSSVHPKYHYTEPGSYLTLTTCTPEFSSAYRLIVWGTLSRTVPR